MLDQKSISCGKMVPAQADPQAVSGLLQSSDVGFLVKGMLMCSRINILTTNMSLESVKPGEKKLSVLQDARV